jgi:hypothetical protein
MIMAAVQPAEGTSSEDAEDVGQALSYLRLLWGDDEFMIGHDEQGYWAARRGQVGGRIIRAAGPDDLGAQMNDDAGPAR